jgi:hypothetical protein
MVARYFGGNLRLFYTRFSGGQFGMANGSTASAFSAGAVFG